MKIIGVLTMHRPINYGSALQAWSTIKILEDLGFKVELIDYIYPNEGHKRKKKLVERIRRFTVQAILGFPWARKEKKFKQFWINNYKLSKKYPDRQSLLNDCPDYDIYVVGSDQVWNPNMIKGDSSFLLDFIPEGRKKISLSSSFAVNELPEKYRKTYAYNLLKFDSISVRENNGAILVKKLIDKDVEVTLDPTLMIASNSYEELVSQSRLNIKESYILVYMLKYAFDPYPYATNFIKEAYRQTGLKIVCIDFSHTQKIDIPDFVHFNDAIGPQDFLWLFKNASMVVTNSFHGAAFAVNYGKSVYAIGNPNKGDDRVASILSAVGLENRVYNIDADFPKFNLSPLDRKVDKKLHKLRILSKEYLVEALNR